MEKNNTLYYFLNISDLYKNCGKNRDGMKWLFFFEIDQNH